jgi:hypothetical protein
MLSVVNELSHYYLKAKIHFIELVIIMYYFTFVGAVNHSVSVMSSTATYSNIQPPDGTESHLIYSNIGNHANSELGNTYSNVGAFSTASNVGKF